LPTAQSAALAKQRKLKYVVNDTVTFSAPLCLHISCFISLFRLVIHTL